MQLFTTLEGKGSVPNKQQSTKGNPAHVRMANAHRKAHRAEMWAKQQARKEKRREHDLESARSNRIATANGVPSRWRVAKECRYLSQERVAKRRQWALKMAAESVKAAIESGAINTQE